MVSWPRSVVSVVVSPRTDPYDYDDVVDIKSFSALAVIEIKVVVAVVVFVVGTRRS